MITKRHIEVRWSARQIPVLLQTLFAAELVTPSKCLWLVSPWISDIAVMDNTANGFFGIEPTWGRTHLRLTHVLSCLAARGSTIHVATRPDHHNNAFLEALRSRCAGLPGPVKTHSVEELHSKGLLGDGYYLSGSMNFTHNGLTRSEETVILETSPKYLAERHLEFRERWGGVGNAS